MVYSASQLLDIKVHLQQNNFINPDILICEVQKFLMQEIKSLMLGVKMHLKNFKSEK